MNQKAVNYDANHEGGTSGRWPVHPIQWLDPPSEQQLPPDIPDASIPTDDSPIVDVDTHSQIGDSPSWNCHP